MRLSPKAESYRIRTGKYRTNQGDLFGAFIIPFRSYSLTVIVSDGSTDGWEHVSVSLPNRNPNWEEMCLVKQLFWAEDECVVQFHPKEVDYVNNHPNCLHMWRCKNQDFPTPPVIAVGIKDLGVMAKVTGGPESETI